MNSFKIFALFCLFSLGSIAQNKHKPLEQIDVLHYQFNISLNDSTNTIQGLAQIDVKFLKPSPKIWFNLVGTDKNQTGMTVLKVLQDKVEVGFSQSNNLLLITTANQNPLKHSVFTIKYKGVPKDGLIISKNKFGNRTFFGDNWPNRAQNWLPCVDYLSDKAYVDFFVTAPSHYQVVANGQLIEQTNLNKSQTLTHFKSSVPLATDVMVIGAAQFAVQQIGRVNNIPVSTWVYPENKEDGFKDYALAKNILLFFQATIAPFPFKKLANVQSKTRFGGMENASNIFYSEKSVNGLQNNEALLAHEIAHQWFGDSATESDWPHLWLSEGFATYFTNLYLENKHGKSTLDNKLKAQRQKIINFSKRWQKPVVDYKTTKLMRLLNANSYEKGAWFLHMLRRKLGDDMFFKVIKAYYHKYKLNTASTTDFLHIAQSVSHKNLESFFKQWLYQVGQPKLNVSWQYKSKKVILNIAQIQEFKSDFNFKLAVKFLFKDQSSLVKTFNINQKMQYFEFKSTKKPVKIELDPNTDLLFEMGQIKP